MLARRFTIVCLIVTIFGIGFADVVARRSGPSPRWLSGTVVSCVFEQGLMCPRSER